MQVHALASGSSGNSVLVEAGGRFLLIDAGVGPRNLLAALKRRGVAPGGLVAVLLTHEHDDHLKGVPAVCQRLQAPLVANSGTLQAAAARVELPAHQELPTGGQAAFGPFRVRSFAVPHDAAEPVGFVVEASGARMAYATDCGTATPAVRDALRGASLCVLESNHDLDWLRRGPYPYHMKVRVESDHGHLSNAAAVETLAERLEEEGPATIWLAHLSAVNNSPAFARRYALEQLATRTRTSFHLEVALRDRPSVSWSPGRLAFQPSLF